MICLLKALYSLVISIPARLDTVSAFINFFRPPPPAVTFILLCSAFPLPVRSAPDYSGSGANQGSESSLAAPAQVIP